VRERAHLTRRLNECGGCCSSTYKPTLAAAAAAAAAAASSHIHVFTATEPPQQKHLYLEDLKAATLSRAAAFDAATPYNGYYVHRGLSVGVCARTAKHCKRSDIVRT
jgi:hypothetical protein